MESIKKFGSSGWARMSSVFSGDGDDGDELLESGAGGSTLLGQLNEATTLTRMQVRAFGFHPLSHDIPARLH
jgi:hypothetical protein